MTKLNNFITSLQISPDVYKFIVDPQSWRDLLLIILFVIIISLILVLFILGISAILPRKITIRKGKKKG